MKKIKISIISIIALIIIFQDRGYAQGFINLNFEATSLISNGSPNTVSTAVGLPGWTAFIGGTNQTTILYNDGTLGNSCVAILGNGNQLNPIIAGNFSVFLTAGATGNAAISQTGLVPIGSQTIYFESYSQGNGLPLVVTLNGQAVNVQVVSVTPDYTLYGGDVSAFAGQSVNLAFTATSNYPQGFAVIGLDAISFSPAAVPEPSTLALLGLGGLLVLRRRQLPSY